MPGKTDLVAMSVFHKEALAMAHNPHALQGTLKDLNRQLQGAKERGDFGEAEELYATLAGLKAEVAAAKENIVGGKFRLEMAVLGGNRRGEDAEAAGRMRQLESDVNMHIEATVDDLERVHQAERAELEQLLQDKVRLEFTPTPEMLVLKTRVESLLKAKRFDKAEVARRDLINQEQRDRRAFAESLWRSWGCRRNKLAFKQSIERSRCESDIASMKAKFQVDRKDAFANVVRHHNFQAQCIQERYAKLNSSARTDTKNAKLRLPPVKASGGIPVSSEMTSPRTSPRSARSDPDDEGEGGGASSSTFARLRRGPCEPIAHRGWLFRKCNRSKAARAGSAGQLCPEGRRVVRTKRSQSAGGHVAATRWEHIYAVMPQRGGIYLYDSEADYAEGRQAAAHVDLSNGELRVPSESSAERNFQVRVRAAVYDFIRMAAPLSRPPLGGWPERLSGPLRHACALCIRALSDGPRLRAPRSPGSSFSSSSTSLSREMPMAIPAKTQKNVLWRRRSGCCSSRPRRRRSSWHGSIISVRTCAATARWRPS